MKHVLFATTALAATLYIVSPSWAAEAPSGYVDAGYVHTEAKSGSAKANGDGYAVSGSVNAPISDRWTVKGDLSIAKSDGSSDTQVTGTAHAFANTGQGWLVGGFVGGTHVSGDDAWAGGVEAQKSFDKTSLQGTVGYGKIDSVDAKIWNVRGDLNYFPADNVRLSATTGWDRVEVAGGHADAWTAGVGGEYQFAAKPVSLFAAWDHSEVNDFHVKSDAFTLGVRYRFGGKSLHDANRSGDDFGGVDRVFGGLF